MSAAEKLKMLGAPSDDPFWMQEEQNGWVIDIISALPQIVAVVEAATELAEESFERMAAADLKAWDAPYEIVYSGEQVEKYRAALAALDEALGDVT